jgi:hypothetical protein
VWERKKEGVWNSIHVLAYLPDMGPHYECDNKHVSSNEACKLTNCITEMFLNLIQDRGGEKEGEKRAN